MPSKVEKQKARNKHQLQKRRAKYSRVMNKYAKDFTPFGSRSEYTMDEFNAMVEDLCKLNVKYLQVLLNDLRSGYEPPWSGNYHRMLQSSIESSILERTILK